MTLGKTLIVVLILTLLGVLPTWPHSRTGAMAPAAVSA
jgi:hypothetical protein